MNALDNFSLIHVPDENPVLGCAAGNTVEVAWCPGYVVYDAFIASRSCNLGV